MSISIENSRNSLFLAAEEGQAFWVLGEYITFKVRGNQTEGAYAMTEVVTLPQGGPAPHQHLENDEAYYILEGEYQFKDLTNSREWKAGPGSFVYIARKTVHVYQNMGTTNAKYLLVQTPAGLEGFFEDLGLSSQAGNQPGEQHNLDVIIPVAMKYKTQPGI